MSKGKDGKPFKREKDAKDARRDELSARDKGEHVEPTKQTVRGYFTEWLSGQRSQVEVSSFEAYKWATVKHIVPALGDYRLQAITTRQLNKLYGDLQAGGLSAGSIQLVHSVISKACREAVEMKELPVSPAVKAKAPRIANKATEMKTWSASEVSTFLAGVESDRLSALYRFLALTGCTRRNARPRMEGHQHRDFVVHDPPAGHIRD